MDTRKPTYVSAIGTVSAGTLRDEDLIPAFAWELETHMKRLRLSREQRKRFNETLRWAREYEVSNGFDSNGFDELTNNLIDALSEIAAPYMYFGAIDGDGADFGFWPVIDAAEEQVTKVNAGDELPRNCEVLIVTDHGNCTCGYVNARGKLTIYWECA